VKPPFVFMDLRTRDLDASRRFYTRLFGWTVTEVAAGPVSVPMFTDAEGPWGGFTALTADDDRIPQWIPYAQVTGLDEAARRATDLGATIVRPRTDLPVGSLIVIQDPTGAALVLWEPASSGANA
jgi:uncharacterized protein